MTSQAKQANQTLLQLQHTKLLLFDRRMASTIRSEAEAVARVLANFAEGAEPSAPRPAACGGLGGSRLAAPKEPGLSFPRIGRPFCLLLFLLFGCPLCFPLSRQK